MALAIMAAPFLGRRHLCWANSSFALRSVAEPKIMSSRFRLFAIALRLCSGELDAARLPRVASSGGLARHFARLHVPMKEKNMRPVG
jgi:hypothetical protein